VGANFTFPICDKPIRPQLRNRPPKSVTAEAGGGVVTTVPSEKNSLNHPERRSSERRFLAMSLLALSGHQ
jgi:hypothetical protein